MTNQLIQYLRTFRTMSVQPIDKKITKIYDFLLKNRSYNTTVQRRFYSEAEDKLISLLYKVQATQSQPKLDNVAAFWRMYHQGIPASYSEIINITGQSEMSYNSLYQGMIKQASWGPKVSALFVKVIYHIHCDERYSGLAFLDDAPKLIEGDRLYLPVDRVIIHFFNHIGYPGAKTFSNINKYLQSRFTGKEMEVWDDLWFWGFIGQKGDGERVPEWNESKFWAIPYVDKSKIDEVKELVEEFVSIIKE